MFGRKSKSGRIAAQELARRLRDGELDSVLTPAGGFLLEHAHATEAQRRQVLPDPTNEPPICEKHGYYGKPGRPHAPASTCPECLAEQDHHERKPARSEADVEAALRADHRVSPLDEVWRVWCDKHPERVGIRPGSVEEYEALDRIEQRREDEREREAARSARGGRVVIERIEHGAVVQYLAPSRRGQRGPLGLTRVVL